MARGFWTGLLHGGVVSAAGLVALSLALPLPGTAPPATNPPETAGSVPQDGAAKPAQATGDGPASADAVSAEPASREAETRESGARASEADGSGQARTPTPPDDAGPTERASATPAPDRPQAEGAPSAGAVDLPVGSEFGRGGDLAPQMPAPLAVPGSRMRQSEAPAVAAPAAEPAPVALTGDNRRPQTEPARGPALASPEDDAGDAPDLTRPDAISAPAAPAVPRMAGAGAQDEAPARPTASQGDAARTAPARPADETAPDAAAVTPAATAESVPQPANVDPAAAGSRSDAADPAVSGGSDAVAPSMPQPSLDLSLPPDLSDLRSLERD
ncbi:hypothetical protein [Paracoccus sp. (in: a-proteobacteria)]|uniref:hypothetical protein n=1 Tax=Paracoccus sp. TaxID=267 RepID=UPI00405A1F87